MHPKAMFKKLLLLFLMSCVYSTLPAQQNVVLIIADDLGTDYLSFYENHLDTAALPNIQRLLPNGVRFKNAWANPLCSPSRAGILTGRHSFRTGVGTAVQNGTATISTSEITIPLLLKNLSQQNIATANIGKWHLSNATPVSNLLIPNQMGYDYYEGLFTGALSDYYNWTKTVNGSNVTVNNYSTTEITNNAVSWISTHHTSPFFLWLAYNAPHTPYHLPPAGMYTNTSLTGTATDIANNKPEYFKAMLEALDFQIGRVLDTLQALQLMQNTTIIFIGDNGDDQQIVQTVGAGRAKGSLYQAGVCVPMIVSGQQVVNPGRSSNALVSTHDLFATIIELMGYSNWQNAVPGTVTIDSKSLMPVVLNQTDSVRPWAFTEVFGSVSTANGKAMRNEQYKLIDFDTSAQKLYFLPTDSNEVSDRLITNMSATDSANYAYLCNEMALLTGQYRFCDLLGTNIEEEVKKETALFVYPNPFTANIKLNSRAGIKSYVLLDALGKIVFMGDDVESRNFNALAGGVYFLKTYGGDERTFKLVKE